jgi:predicted ferric reductase
MAYLEDPWGSGGVVTAGPPSLRRPPAARGWAGRRLLVVVLWAGLAVSLALWWLDTPASSLNNRGELLIAGGRITGLIAGYVLLVEVALRSRIGLLERWVGAELILKWHREFGFVLLVSVLAHAVLSLLGYAVVDRVSWFAEVKLFLSDYEDMTSAVVALGILIGVCFLALRAIRAMIPYEAWKVLHGASYLVLLLGYGHQFANGQQLFQPGLARDYWLGLYLLVIACLVWGRVIAPVWLNLRHSFQVAEVVDEGRDVISIYLSGRNLKKAGRAGQFYRWRFLAGGLWTQAHPFSLSAATNPHWLRLTVKAVGRHTSTLRTLRPGVRVWAQGPMGSFTAVRRTRGRALLIAGGIGIGPIRALLEELPSGAAVIYRASTSAEVVLREELDRIAEMRHADVWYVIGNRDDPGPRAMMTGTGMMQIVPDVAARDAYLCGPEGFIKGARRALRAAGVPRRQIHETMFEM